MNGPGREDERELWKCRAEEAVENCSAVCHRSHRPWKSLRDSHIPTATANPIRMPIQPKTERSPADSQLLFFRLILR
jgi:hypothetical protein